MDAPRDTLIVTLSPVEYLTVENTWQFTTLEKTKKTVNWDFSQIPKQVYKLLQYEQKYFAEFQSLSRFPRKMVLYWSTKVGIIKPWTNIQSIRRFDLGFWQTSKQICRKLQYKEKVFGEFQSFPHFPRKMVLYLLTKFGVTKPWTNISWLRRFSLGFWETSKKIYSNLQKISFSQKNGFVFVDQIWYYKDLNRHSIIQKIRFELLTDFKTKL